MQFFHHVRPRLVLYGRVLMWATIGLFVVVGLFTSVPAWAEPTACTGNSTTGNSTIPIAPLTLFLKFGGPVSTYQVSLCEEPDAPVDITITEAPTGKVTITPVTFTLSSTISQTVSVEIADDQPVDEPFTVVITHSAASEDPDFNYGSLNVPRVTAYYSPPVAVEDLAAPLFGQGIAINVRANDIDRLGQGLTLPTNAIVTNPTHGTASLNVTQTIQYTPTTGYSGLDSFTYRVEDGIGNTDIATVTVSVADENVVNPQIEEMDPEQGGEVEFESSLGDFQVQVPPLEGVPATSTVVIVFGEVITPSGDLDDAPIPVGSFSGIALKLEILVDGVPLEPGQLSEPVEITVPLPDTFAQGLNGARMIIAVWDGTSWVTEGIVIEYVTEPTSPGVPSNSVLRFRTSAFGEFVIFIVWEIFMPLLERQ